MIEIKRSKFGTAVAKLSEELYKDAFAFDALAKQPGEYQGKIDACNFIRERSQKINSLAIEQLIIESVNNSKIK